MPTDNASRNKFSFIAEGPFWGHSEDLRMSLARGSHRRIRGQAWPPRCDHELRISSLCSWCQTALQARSSCSCCPSLCATSTFMLSGMVVLLTGKDSSRSYLLARELTARGEAASTRRHRQIGSEDFEDPLCRLVAKQTSASKPCTLRGNEQEVRQACRGPSWSRLRLVRLVGRSGWERRPGSYSASAP